MFPQEHEYSDTCDCINCGFARFTAPEPATFVSGDDADACDCPICTTPADDPLEQYALGWTHGWDDHEKMVDEGREPAERIMGRRGLFNGFCLASIVWAAIGLFILACPAQSPFPPHTVFYTPAPDTAKAPAILAGSGPFNYGYVMDSARVMLEQAWDTQNPAQVERGYCIEPADIEVDSSGGVVNWMVHHVRPPVKVTLATPYAISFYCTPAAIASIHIHTPTTCKRAASDPYGTHPTNCVFGGNDSALCSVDETDRAAARKDAFMAVQCDRRAFVFYFAGRRG